ncbi:hypothetical protein ACE2AJ_16350 [Aquihabitans daechungensis]|uniref:hypothetical protein n=1 Tax=Aquihabitans daechungensis TaxID=1052257 RepID=UPI003B9F1F5A
MTALLRLRLWPLRALWVVLALAAAGPVADALDPRSTPVAATVAAAAWTTWGAALVALLVPRTLSLTIARILIPAGAVGAIVVVAIGDDSTLADAVTVVVAALVIVAVLAPWTTDAFVDGSSYGPERRIALRTPLALVLLAVMTWVVVVTGVAGAVLLLAAAQWVAGAVAVAIGAAVAWFGARSIHQLSKRWLVLVPTGLVIHDPLVMPEPQLFLRQTMDRLGPAEGDVGETVTTEDLTAGAAGLVMSITLTEPVELLVRDGSRGTTLRPVDRVLFSPALPAQLLAEARQRRLPVA